ncbi:histidinol-phosphate transaminase [Candidatus Formimonas warabiya]|uniref:Histidinol-phosphate aminotransferase n=1 Tax=Formimonas warabiya TaxID=1761012 RepID=A0A3G1KZJ8_FORW1|nr:histidinol-phosphate transaminase [Candidatus Formimonas warabiya]ATW27804.1 histidinol-phosphate transaminase [Candidatus Formimonas warabiya]
MENIKEKDLARRGINELVAYVPGKPIEEVKREYGLTEIIKLASNENPLGTSPKAVAAMKQAIDDVYMYPEGSSMDLRQKVAAHFGIDDDMVIIGNGADNILLLIAQALVDEGDEVITGDPSFSVYESVTRIMGGNFIKVPLKDFTYDLPAIAERITDKTKLIFICNPNNPTGSMVTEEETARFMEIVPRDCVVAFDEAYAEYVQDQHYPDTMKYVHEKRNVILVRTFSKIFGLAGTRIGYAMGPKHLVDLLRKVTAAFAVNRVAQAGALAALEDREFIEKVLTVNEQGKQYLYQEFSKLGMPYTPTHTNFIFVNLGMDSQVVFKKLLAQGIVIRPGGMWNLPNYARITLGTLEQNEKLIAALKEIINK